LPSLRTPPAVSDPFLPPLPLPAAPPLLLFACAFELPPPPPPLRRRPPVTAEGVVTLPRAEALLLVATQC